MKLGEDVEYGFTANTDLHDVFGFHAPSEKIENNILCTLVALFVHGQSRPNMISIYNVVRKLRRAMLRCRYR
jgi:hypothetical protein